uniref:LYR motif containing 5b n=1 Tax=Pygocentrus nattereri TaxID=42514 RepID=A0AAR2JR13_PYGNA
MANPLKSEVVRLYKTLLFLGREYPKGTDYFRDRLRAAFTKNRDVKDPEEIRQLLSRGEYVVKELEALYYLRKYRAMKKRYYDSAGLGTWCYTHGSDWNS